MTERDPQRLADELERETDQLARRSEELRAEAEDVRDDWRRKRAAGDVPGAVPPEEHRPDDEPPGSSGPGPYQTPGGD